MTSRAEWYLARGWSTLLVDLRATGESEGAHVSMGWHEATDLRAWHAEGGTVAYTDDRKYGTGIVSAAFAPSTPNPVVVLTAKRCVGLAMLETTSTSSRVSVVVMGSGPTEALV